MAGEYEFIMILMGVIGIMVLATLIGEYLKSRYSPNHENEAIENLVLRIYGWWYMVITLAIALLAGHVGITILFFLLSFGAMREFLTLTEKRRADHRALVLSYYLILPLQYIFVYFGWYSLFSIFIPVFGFFILAISQALRGDTRNYLSRVAETQWALMITIYSVSYVAALDGLEIRGYEGRSFLLIAYLALVVQSSDVMQYLFSQALGGRRFAPRLMPSRTWPGVVCGVLSATLIGGLLYWMTPFAFEEALLISLILCLLGFFGSVVMRAIKRDRGVREWGHIIAGHGGVVDRLDSIMFSAPIFYLIVHYFWAH